MPNDLIPFLTDITIRCFACIAESNRGAGDFVSKTGHIDLPRARKGGFFEAFRHVHTI